MTSEESSSSRLALYRKYRSRSLKEVIGQPQVTDVLTKSLAKGQIAHAYLLTGPRGVGKTSIARILAHEINGLPYSDESTHLDIIEIDAASNNGVENVRELREKSHIAPVVAKYKVYIIDEVHMLSKPAFNALLKTLEEPPAHVVFILATTDLHKVPATIISRTQHYSFHSISLDDLVKHLRQIADAEKIKIDDEALQIIARRGDGSFRDSISILDQISIFADSKNSISVAKIQDVLGIPNSDLVNQLLKAVNDHEVSSVIDILSQFENQGVQADILTDQIIDQIRERLGTNGRNIKLLNSLIDVRASSQPQLKLLAILVAAARPKTAASRVAAPPRPTVIEAPVVIVEKPMEVRSTTIAKQTVKQPLEPKKPIDPKTLKEFSWTDLLAYSKEHSIALNSVLLGCDYILDGEHLKIFAVRKFNKTKLDQPKYLTQMREALEAIGCANLEVEVVAETKPPSDAKLAAVADLLGGAVEVKLEGDS